MDLKKILPIAVIGVAVLALVIFAAFGQGDSPSVNTAQPGTGTQVPQTGQSGQAAQPGAAAPQTGGQLTAPSAAAPQSSAPVSSKDPATIVPATMTLDQFCEKYYKAWIAKDWKTAYDLQSYANKGQGDATSFGQQREGYGLVGYKVGTPAINGNVANVPVTMNLGTNGTWMATWTFIKNDKGQWTVQGSKSGPSQ